MATPTALERMNRGVLQVASAPLRILHYASTEPLITGAALFALTRAPIQYRHRLLSALRDRGVSIDGIARLVKVLKLLLGIGVLRRLNRALTALALNMWHLRKPGAPFQFGMAGKPEIVVVTGGCSGFGYEMVKGFSKYARVIVLDISPIPPELAKIPDVHYYQLDLSDFSAIESTAEQIRQEQGNPSVLINNAGIATGTSVIDSSAKLTERIFKVNIACHFILIKEFLPAMLRARKGHIVTIASMASFLAAPGLVDYCCTKVGALYLNDGLRAELRDRYENGDCIQTTSVHPSWHDTGIVKPFTRILKKNGVRMDPPSNVSDAVIEQVLSSRSGQIFMPRGEERGTHVRSWPVWLQDAYFYTQRKRSLAAD
ncbi:uncharacterized protein PV06_02891 [Exophiala oligosperma]|uniref:Uncharacterized protein n=2 Tax=Chaetothyriales TaxID=34395 RepID=A0A0D2DPJ8_9EURO|nr:uncharacterized protein PV06_02891 [Exophiala oligosperma]KAJ9632534.1 hypothetical protein H2204_007838 [Knufia peltigerae]KIW44420.1 hypothetical protein PV06_02891 [Exophiala oligosperma]